MLFEEWKGFALLSQQAFSIAVGVLSHHLVCGEMNSLRAGQ